MPKSQKTTTTKPALPIINLSANNSELIWQLLTEVEHDGNRKVLCGKEPGEVSNPFFITIPTVYNLPHNSSSESKIAVYRWMAKVIIPDVFSIDMAAAGDRVKNEFEW